MTKENIAIYIAMIRQLLHLEPCTEDEMNTHVNQIKENLDNKWYYFWIRSLYFDGPWVRDLDLVKLHKDLRDNIKYNGLTTVKHHLKECQDAWGIGPIHAAFDLFVFYDKWKLLHGSHDPQDCPAIRAGKTFHYCTCELEQRTFQAMLPSLPDHPNPDDIKRFS
jgi:hypothetical protein